MRFDLKDGGQTFANVDDPGVFTRTLDNLWTLGGEFLQMQTWGRPG